MSSKEQFSAEMRKGYETKGGALEIGAAIYESAVIPEAVIRIPLKTLNRHGLIAGATGTGKTKTLQVLAEEMSKHGIPTLMMDIKGDLSGLAKPGTENEKIKQRHAAIGTPWKAEGVPVELFTLTDAPGVRLRATVSEFGPVLFSKILDLNDTQSGVVSLVFKIADDRQWPILDLKDFRKVLQYLTNEGKEEIRKDYGAIATSTASTIIRKIVEIEEQGADLFFGEPSFDVEDLLQLDEKGRAYSGILRLSDIQDRPKLFSTFMLSLLAEIYERFPETGDTDQPRLVIFIDEAHLIFKEASDALLDQIETIVKLIRSKGVGIIFCTQSPTDIPAIVLSQLGLKIQHALRAFTANDRKAIKQAAGNYPESEFYVPDQVITQLGTGEALVTALSEKGNPTPLAVVMLKAPGSRMDILSSEEIDNIVSSGSLRGKYNAVTDRESAYEILREKLSGEGENKPGHKQQKEERKDESVLGDIIGSTTGRQVARTIAREVTRGLLGVLGIGTRRRR
jgi:DNA helicase HerA-like ATPase